MRVSLCLVTAASVVVGTALVAPIGRAAPSSVGPDSASAGVAAAATATTPALVAPAPDLVPVEPTVRSVVVPSVPGDKSAAESASRLAKSPTAPVVAARTAAEPAHGFVVTGATWTGNAPAGLELRVRTRTDGVWSPWSTMGYDLEHGPDAGSSEAEQARPGTDPFVAGDVDDVQLEASSADGSAPSGLALDIVSPGASVAASGAADGVAAQSRTTTATARKAAISPVAVPRPTPRPTIYSRAQWGASESLRDCCVELGEIHAAFVHHTVNANNYTAAEVPAILRGIYAYHTQSRGWRDIGYNFLIDRFGRIWEGRYGGVTRPVVGAHTLNYNENAFAASAIGNFETAKPSAAMLDAYARLFAWKLSLSGIAPTTRQKVAGTRFNAVSGHRDAASTACPGINLYRKIPDIIAKTADYQNPFAGRGIYRTFAGDNKADVLAVSRVTGRASAARGTAPPKFGAPKAVRSDFAGMDQVVVTGDVTGDGRVDVIGRSTETSVTRIYTGNGSGAFTPSTTTKRWAETDLFAAPGDLDGDGRNDIVARQKDTRMLQLYRGGATGRFKAPATVGDLTGIRVLTGAGDFDKDGHPDLLTRGAGGVLRVLLGDGAGAFSRSVVLADNWKNMNSIAGGVDLTGDGRPDIVARNSTTKTTRIYANVDGSRLSPGVGATTTSLNLVSLSSDADGNSVPDIVSNVGGNLTLLPVYRQNYFAPKASLGTVMTGAKKVLVVGEWDRDGYVDTMSLDAGAKRLWLYQGGPGSGAAKKRVGGWTNLTGYRSVTSVGDFDGDGWADLMARAPSGRIHLFRGHGAAGLRAKPILVRSSMPAGSIFGIGRWDSDGAPDVALKTRTGRMYVYPGNGPGGLDDPILLGSGFRGYNAMVYLGDVTGDGRPDLAGRNRLGDLFVLPKAAGTAGHPAGTIGPRLFAGSGFQGYRIG